MWKVRKFSYNRLSISLLFNIYADRKNVRFLKTNSGKKGEGMPVVRNQMFYFKERFCSTECDSSKLYKEQLVYPESY